MSNDEQREAHMIESILGMVREALGEKIRQVEQAAADAAEDADEADDKPIIAKLALSLKWPAGQHEPVIEMTASHTVRRTINFQAKADGSQSKLPFGEQE